MRLQKWMAQCGAGSRRACEQYIVQGRVRVNGQLVTQMGVNVEPEDAVELDGRLLTMQEQMYYYMLHKPKGVVSTAKDTHGRQTVVDLLPVGLSARLYPVGRLDANTEGLILMTNDGEFANRLMHPRYHLEKQYRVVMNGDITAAQVERLRQGVMLEDGKTLPCQVEVERTGNSCVLYITLRQGKNRQIRRMMEAVGCRVQHLRRIRIGQLTLGDLPMGAVRPLTQQEVQDLLERCGAEQGK